MRLNELSKTTGFRLALFFLLLFGTASLTVFGFMYWRTIGYATAGIDDWLVRAAKGYDRLDYEQIISRFDDHTARDPGGQRPFGAFDSSGRQIAGQFTLAPADFQSLDKPIETSINLSGTPTPVRAVVHRTPSGAIVVVTQNIHELRQFSDALLEAMTWGALLTLAVGLLGAAFVGIRAVRRVDAVTYAIQRVVGGDLSGRLPSNGTTSDFDRLVFVVNGMLSDIERLMHEVKGACDGIAHDLRTPLTRLLAGLERIQRRANSVHEYKAAVDEAIAEISGLLKTFTAMLRISEMEDAARRAGFTQVNLVRVAQDVVEFYQPLADEKQILLSFRSDGLRDLRMLGDPSLLFEVVGNLVDNALKFTPEGGSVAVSIFSRKDVFGIRVVDSGPGIPVEEREAVLVRFYRVERSRTTPGSGLGLSLAVVVARLHGMRLEIEDVPTGCSIKLERPNVVTELETSNIAKDVAIH